MREALEAELGTRQIFIAPEVLEELVFYIARESQGQELIRAVLERIRDARATRPGILVFPLHSLGVLGAGLVRPSDGRVTFINGQRGYALSPQTNSLDGTMQFLDDARQSFGIGQELPTDLILHWY